MRTKEIHEKSFNNYNRIFSFNIRHYCGGSDNDLRKQDRRNATDSIK